MESPLGYYIHAEFGSVGYEEIDLATSRPVVHNNGWQLTVPGDKGLLIHVDSAAGQDISG